MKISIHFYLRSVDTVDTGIDAFVDTIDTVDTRIDKSVDTSIPASIQILVSTLNSNKKYSLWVLSFPTLAKQTFKSVTKLITKIRSWLRQAFLFNFLVNFTVSFLSRRYDIDVSTVSTKSSIRYRQKTSILYRRYRQKPSIPVSMVSADLSFFLSAYYEFSNHP